MGCVWWVLLCEWVVWFLRTGLKSENEIGVFCRWTLQKHFCFIGKSWLGVRNANSRGEFYTLEIVLKSSGKQRGSIYFFLGVLIDISKLCMPIYSACYADVPFMQHINVYKKNCWFIYIFCFVILKCEQVKESLTISVRKVVLENVNVVRWYFTTWSESLVTIIFWQGKFWSSLRNLK